MVLLQRLQTTNFYLSVSIDHQCTHFFLLPSKNWLETIPEAALSFCTFLRSIVDWNFSSTYVQWWKNCLIIWTGLEQLRILHHTVLLLCDSHAQLLVLSHAAFQFRTTSSSDLHMSTAPQQGIFPWSTIKFRAFKIMAHPFELQALCKPSGNSLPKTTQITPKNSKPCPRRTTNQKQG